MSDATKRYLVAGEWKPSEETFDVKSPYDDKVVATVASPSDADVEAAVAAASESFGETRKLPLHVRADALAHISERLAERSGEIAELIAREGGKPLKWAKVEAARAVSTFGWAAEECRREGGELMRFDSDASAGARVGIVRRFPLGPVLAITPFNFPVNLVAHKMAPALAVGAPIVIKPATKTPLGALLLGELFCETELPEGMLSVLPIGGSKAGELAKDERFAKISFTGSSQVGWDLKQADPKKTVTLELGGNAGVIVHSDADLERAASRIAFGGYYQAGQSCIAVQRVLVQRDVADEFRDLLAAEVSKLKTGDPLDPETDVGPLIDHDSLERVSAWVDEAVQSGAEIVTGGKREDPFYLPTVLSRTTDDMKVRCEEIFGPVVTLGTYERFEDAIEEVNNSRYGLQAGVFTRDVDRIFLAHRDIEVGGVIANDVSSFRADQMPYGGTKDSGRGREGLRWAMDEMTEPRILVLSDVPL
ncbi:MAG TPA: aldehyde dehydrogenase family protein [Actinomycetota bacterium]|nr:aldehyde dehydrogenase family protein [Actinomycetota bacterium]